MHGGRALRRQRRGRVVQQPRTDDRRADQARHLRPRRHERAPCSAPPDGCTERFLRYLRRVPARGGRGRALLEANPGLDVAELQQLLEDRALDAGHSRATTTSSAPAGSASAPPATPPSPHRKPSRASPRCGCSTAVRAPSTRRRAPTAPRRWAPTGKVRVKVRDIVGVPDDATAVVLNVTAVAPTAGGYVTVHPGGRCPTRPTSTSPRGRPPRCT